MSFVFQESLQRFTSLGCCYLWCSTVFPTAIEDHVKKSCVKVHLTPKDFFRLNNSLHLFETQCAFLHPFSPNLDFLQAVKVTKSDHHLFHDRASKGYGSIPGLMSQTYLHACLQRLNTMQISLWRQPRNRPIPLTSSVVQQTMARFRNFYSL